MQTFVPQNTKAKWPSDTIVVFFLLFLYKIVFEDFLPVRAYNDVFHKENLMFYFLNNREKDHE